MVSDHFSPSLFATTMLAQSVFQLCGPAGIPPSRSLDYGDYMNVVRAPMPDPLQYNTANEFAKAYLSYNLLRKYDAFPIDLDRRAAALAGFRSSEVRCGQVNLQADAMPYIHGVDLVLQHQSHIEVARGLVKQALGKFDWAELQGVCAFSSGSSTRVPRKRGNAVFKLDGKPHVTINCRDLAVHFIWCNELWRKICQETFGRDSDPYSWVEVVPGSRFDTVPKDSLIDRPICVEADLNMFFQKGIGTMIRNRLKRCGINLNSQRRNQSLARIGSITGELATIDLSSASDSISLWICRILLPEDWYEALLLTRSAYVLIDGKWTKLEKVSSMGNGFTFELESLLFWALAKAVCKNVGASSEHLTVYGDDIIVPVPASGPLIGLLEALGFSTNINKTFCSGPFRESCGKHYFLGADVSPFKITHPIETWADCYHFANSVREWGWADQNSVDAIVASAIQPIPPRQRCYVPMNYGSKAGLRSPVPQGNVRSILKRGTVSHKFWYMTETTNEHDLSGPVAYLASMLQREQANGSCVDDIYAVPPNSEHGEVNDSTGYGTLSRTVPGSWVRKCVTSSVWSDELVA